MIRLDARVRRIAGRPVVAAVLAAAAVPAARAEEPEPVFFEIGAASTGGTSFAIAKLLAKAISHPPGSRACDAGGRCGAPNVLGRARSSDGAVSNVRRIAQGELPSALVQGDVAASAHAGTWLFAQDPPMPGLRAIANLFPQPVHLAVRAESHVDAVDELAGRRVGVGAPGSGTRVTARAILEAHGVGMDAIAARDLDTGAAADALQNGALDAVFFVGGSPLPAMGTLMQRGGVRLVPISATAAKRLAERDPAMRHHTIPAGTYPGMDAPVRTLAVSAQWVVHARVPAGRVYALTRALWRPANREMLHRGHPLGKRITLDTVLDGLALPVHPGARRFYVERGMLPDSEHAADG